MSSRGVLYLKNQDISAEEMQTFMNRFHHAAGAPESSGLHIHPSINVQGGNAEGRKYQSISSEAQKKAGGGFWRNDQRRFWGSEGWHSESVSSVCISSKRVRSDTEVGYSTCSVSFEKAPADYSMLKLVQLPGIGGDTLFASGEALYERLSPSFAGYLETLQAVHAGTKFIEETHRNGGRLYEGERGVSSAVPLVFCCMLRKNETDGPVVDDQSPFNTNQDLTAIHPVVRTNPVTGKKTVFVNREFTQRIVGLTVC